MVGPTKYGIVKSKSIFINILTFWGIRRTRTSKVRTTLSYLCAAGQTGNIQSFFFEKSGKPSESTSVRLLNRVRRLLIREKLVWGKMDKISEFSKFSNFRKTKLVGFKLVLTSHKRIFEICLIDTLKAYFHLRKFFCHVKINSIIFNYFKLKNLFY